MLCSAVLQLIPLKQSLLLNLELDKQLVGPRYTPVSALHSTGVIDTHGHTVFNTGAEDLNSGHYDYTAMVLAH